MIPLARTMLCLVLALVAASMSVSAAEDKAPLDETLIERLGSSDFAQRERAARMLQARGPTALPALRKAKTHRDAEVRRRVLAMIPILETAAALEPKRITLGRKPQTLSAILQEIEKQTGYHVGRDDKEDERYFCVEMKDASFWEAMERIGRETGRVVNTVAITHELRLNPSEARSPFVALRGPFRLELGSIHEDRNIDFAQPGKGKEIGQRSQRLTLTISILAEPRFLFLDAAQAKVLIATDEDDRTLGPPAPDKQVRWTYDLSPLVEKGFTRTAEIVLRRASEKARKIKVLRGTIAVQVVVERKRVVLTENILKAKGAKCRTRQGSLEITKVEKRDNGKLEILITAPAGREGVSWHWFDRIRLEDSKGNLYQRFSQESTGGSPNEVIVLRYHASKDHNMGPPSKLIVEDWTILHYAIPFEFKDVPLP